jgi:nitroimidazol reductase NimA-like FMN-containing flavoprotein (pyridoxamine 5'-phosphate oxidase superfamily)
MLSPGIRELPQDECEALLAVNHVARIAFSHHDHVDIEPISYVYADGWIYGRTSAGSKLRTLAHNRWVALETDQVHSLAEWRSVVVKGALYLLEADGAQSDTYDLALAQIRSLSPHALLADDPTPERTQLFRIHADQMTGRASGV